MDFEKKYFEIFKNKLSPRSEINKLFLKFINNIKHFLKLDY